jgi:hypothetical protein
MSPKIAITSFFLAPLFLTGCLSPVVTAGPNTYYVSKGPLPIWMSAAKAKAACYRKASAWCDKRGLVMVPISSDAQEPIAARKPGSAELTFVALPPSVLSFSTNSTTIQRTQNR